MSLDVYLTTDTKIKEICQHCNGDGILYSNVDEFSANITHNLAQMAEQAGIYMAIWRPEEIGITHAKQLIEPLRKGLISLKDYPNHYKLYNSSNGWGSYENFVPWVEKYLEACIINPEAKVHVSR